MKLTALIEMLQGELTKRGEQEVSIWNNYIEHPVTDIAYAQSTAMGNRLLIIGDEMIRMNDAS